MSVESFTPEEATEDGSEKEIEFPGIEEVEGPLDLDSEKIDKEKSKYRIGFVNIDLIKEAEVQDATAESLAVDEEAEKKKGFFKRTLGNIWKGNMARDYYEHKAMKQARAKIEKSGSVYGASIEDQNLALDAHEEAMSSVVERFTSEYDEVIHNDAGESRKVLSQENAKDEKERLAIEKTQEKIRNAILKYSHGVYDLDIDHDSPEEAFMEDQGKIINELIGEKADLKDQTLAYAANLLEIAKNVRDNKEHLTGLDLLDDDFEIVVGQATHGVRGEAKYGVVDKLINKIKDLGVGKYRVGNFISETTLGAGIAVTLGTSKTFGRMITHSKVAAVASIGGTSLLVGGFARARERARIEGERAHVLRTEAKGAKKGNEGSRRAELGEFGYEARAATELADDLEASFYESYDSKENKRELKDFNEENIKNSLNQLAEIEARIRLSDQKRVDLISFSKDIKVEQERTRLDILRAQVKSDLRKATEKNPEILTRLAESSGVEQVPFDDLIDQLTEQKSSELGLEKEVEEKDKAYKAFKNYQGRKAFAKGAVIGAAFGATAQEISALLRDETEGVIEQAINAFQDKQSTATHFTPLAHLNNYVFGVEGGGAAVESVAIPEVITSAPQESAIINMSHSAKLPEGYELQPQGDGSFSIINQGETLAENIIFDENDVVTQASEKILNDAGLGVEQSSFELTQPPIEQTNILSAQEFLQDNAEDTTSIHHLHWYDLGTPKEFEGNELRLHLGGEAGSGVNADGNYEITIESMKQGDSFYYYNGERIDADPQQLLSEGKLKLLFTVSETTQGQVIEVPIKPDANGTVVINPDSAAGKLLSVNEDGTLKIEAKFLEVAEVVSVDDNGTENIRVLATAVGEGVDGVEETVAVPQSETITNTIFENLEIPEAIAENIEDTYEMPWIIPVHGRKPLEKYARNAEMMPYYGYNSNHVAEMDKKYYEKMRSETLKKNPDAKLDHYKETEKYLEGLEKKYKKQVEAIAKDFEPMGPDTKLSICIPVAGHQEGGHIYESLESYSHQIADPDQYEIVLFVNHPKVDREGKQVEPDKTLEEIKRFKKNNRNMNIRVSYSTLSAEQANIGTVRKLLTDAVVLRQHDRGKDVDDLTIVSNDADNRGVAPEYVQNFIDKFEADPKIDGMLGQLDWDPEAYAQYPAVHAGTRLFQYLNLIGRQRTGSLSSSGANFAFRESVYAGIGGYITELEGGEDIAIGQAIVTARKSKTTLGFGGARVSRVYTSARRSVDAFKKGLAPVRQWEEGFSAFDDEIRKFEVGESQDELDYDNPEDLEKLKKDLESVINQTIDSYEVGENLGKDAPYYEKALGFMGLKCRLGEGGKLEIADMGKYVDQLKDYKRYAELQRDAKSGKPGAAEEFSAERKKIKLEKAKEKEKIEVGLEKSLANFYKKDKLSLPYEDPATKLPVLEASANTSKLGEYTVDDDSILRETENGKLTFAYKEDGEDKVYIVKEIDNNTSESVAKKKFQNPDQLSVEEYLKEEGLSHPNILLPIEQFENGNTKRVYEAEGDSLDKVLAKGITLKPKNALSVMIRVTEGIKFLHENDIVHTDISPDNIVMTKDGAKLIDLDGGFMKEEGDKYYKKDGNWGNRFVLPPEMLEDARGNNVFGKSVDIYSSSVTLYKLLTGSYPYNIESQTKDMSEEEKQQEYHKKHKSGDIKFPPSVSPKIQKIIKKGMSPSIGSRYQSIEAMMSDMLAVQKSL